LLPILAEKDLCLVGEHTGTTGNAQCTVL